MAWKLRSSPSLNDLRRAVERVVGVGVVVLAGRELLGEAVDRRGRRGDDLAHLGLDGRLEHVVRAVDEHLEREPRLLRALRDADRGVMEEHVDAGHQLVHERPVADVALDELDGAVGARPVEVLPPPADEVVQHDDLVRAGEHQLVDHVGPDRPAAPGHEDLADTAHSRSLISMVG